MKGEIFFKLRVISVIFVLGATCMTSRLLFIFFTLTVSTAFGQLNPDKDRQVVLRHNKVGKTYVFDRSKKNGYNRTEITYLGKLKTKDGRVFKILISRWYWGLAPRATSRIVVFNNKNQYLGNYYVGMTYDVPDKIQNNALVFDNKNREDCDPNIVTRVSFTNVLPKQFFLECKNKMGDIYTFSDE
ncbi:MAG TPA: hypothetical protein VHB70_11795 [Parafilimonas sp.]|nr:hypothetical protein [Parafilimonas sp.]